MNFKQAYSKLLEGKKIRRKEAKGYYILKGDNIYYVCFADQVLTLNVSVEEALADDWEVVKESKVSYKRD